MEQALKFNADAGLVIDDPLRYVNILVDGLVEKFPQTKLNGSKNLWIVKPG